MMIIDIPKNSIIEHRGRLTDEYMFYYKTDDLQTIGVGEIPIGRYLRNLCETRKFNKKQIYEYTRKVYGIDLTDILDDKQINYQDHWSNIYEKYEKENPRKKDDDGTRKYFNSYGRKYFESFYYKHFEQTNMIVPYIYDPTDVHHIVPIQYGGNNSLENLIYIHNQQHEKLHANPVEYIVNTNYEALDFLIDVYSQGKYRDVIEEYDLYSLFKKDFEMGYDVVRGIVENEIKKFYKLLEQKYSA